MKSLKKKLWVLLLCVAVLTTTAACGGKEADVQGTPTAQVTPAQETTPTSEAKPSTEATPTPEAKPTAEATPVPQDGPYSVTLPDGTVIELAGVPQRILSMGPNITDTLFELGAGERVVGRTDYCDRPAQVADIPSVGTIFSPDVEAILALEPDLVIGSAHFSEETEKQLADLSIKVAVLYDGENMEGVYNIIRALGELVGLKEAGDALAERTKKTMEDTVAKYAGAEYEDFEAPSVYYVVGYGEYGDYTAGGATFIGQLLTAAGGKNVAQDVQGWVIDHESLMEADPQIIVIGEGMAADFCATPGYGELSAVKNNMVIELDTYHLLDRQGYMNAEIFVQLAELFHTATVQ